ncbi:hypothetical protein Tco_1435450, partial [Tanacetum coccineum]
MAALKFASSHNMVAFLDKPTESNGFEEIVDFLNAHPIKYALTVNPTIYTACIEQFWATAKVKTVNGEVQIQALVDKNKVIIIETSVRSDLQLEDAEGTKCLPNATIFEQLTLIGQGKDFSGRDTPLFPIMIVQAQEQKTKTSQAVEITELKERVKRLKKKGGLRTHMIIRLYKVGRSARVVSSKDKGMGDQEDASKHGRKIDEINQDEEVTLVDETQGRYGDNLMFNTGVLDNEQDMVEKKVDMAEKDFSTTGEVVTTANAVLSTAEVTTDIQEPSEFTTTTSPSQPSQLPQAKDKGKAKMVEPEKPLKKKDQIMFDKEVAQKLQSQLDAELEEEEKLA